MPPNRKPLNRQNIQAIQLPPTDLTSVDSLVQMAVEAEAVLEKVREMMVDRISPKKIPPEFSAYQVSQICGIDRPKLKSLEAEIGSERGHFKEGQSQKTYTLKETIELVQVLGAYPAKPVGKKAKVIVIASHKSGVGKTTTAVSLAQGLTLRGLKVLLVDLDVGGSASRRMGRLPEVGVKNSDTLMDFIYGDKPDLTYAPRNTYWHNLDLIAASSILLAAELVLPERSKARAVEIAAANRNGGNAPDVYNDWEQIAIGIEPLKDIYDVLVFDTSQGLSYLTRNAIATADVILTPCPQDALDYASSCQFWGIFAELANLIPGFVETKKYDFVEVVITKAKPMSDPDYAAINQWIKASFGSHLCEFSIPDSPIPVKAELDSKTVYDLDTPKEVSNIVYKRYRDAKDLFVTHVAAQLTIAWRR
jgi:chromosome partitioning protein